MGGQDVGKTYLAKTLISYALKCGHHPLYVDLDPNEVILLNTLPSIFNRVVYLS